MKAILEKEPYLAPGYKLGDEVTILGFLGGVSEPPYAVFAKEGCRLQMCMIEDLTYKGE